MPNQEIPESLIIRKPDLNDGKSIYNLVSKCPPLEINSLYSYLLICSHFDSTSAVAEINQELVGYTSAYIHPHKNDTLFIWQVAVRKDIRGRGVALNMLLNLLNRKNLSKIKYIETTVTPENLASKSLFTSMAVKLGADIKETLFFSRDDFGKIDHHEEFIISIGPLDLHESLPVKMDVNSLTKN